MRSTAIVLFTIRALTSLRYRKHGRSGGEKKMTPTLEMPWASAGRVEPLTRETIELDDLVIVPDVLW